MNSKAKLGAYLTLQDERSEVEECRQKGNIEDNCMG